VACLRMKLLPWNAALEPIPAYVVSNGLSRNSNPMVEKFPSPLFMCMKTSAVSVGMDANEAAAHVLVPVVGEQMRGCTYIWG